MFKRNEKLDKLIMEVKNNNEVLNELTREELKIFIDYMEKLKKYLKKGE